MADEFKAFTEIAIYLRHSFGAFYVIYGMSSGNQII